MSGNALSAGEAPEWLWRNGEIVPWAEATVHVNAVGHASVSAVFEGIKAYRSDDGGRLLLFRLQDHLARLAASARLSRLRLDWTTAELEDACLALLAANAASSDTYLRPWVFAAGIIREQMVPADAPTETVVDSWGFESHLGAGTVCTAGVSSWQRIDDAATPPRVKAFSNYHNGRLALVEAHAHGYDWPILLNRHGKVTEGAAACLAIVADGRVITPPVSSGLLPGLTRDTVLTMLRELGIPVEVREVDRSELYLADEAFFMGTAWEILPIGAIDGMTVGSGRPGPVARALETAYTDLVRGRTPDQHGWLTSVTVGERTRDDHEHRHRGSGSMTPAM